MAIYCKVKTARNFCLLLCTLFMWVNQQILAFCPDAEAIKPCSCNEEGLMCMNVTDSDLLRVFKAPAERKAIRSIWLYQNEFTKLVENNFGDYVMANVYLDLNKISSLAPGTFGKATATLKDLSLSRNDLDKFPWSDLDSMRKLKRFSLSYNKIQEIPGKAFAKCSKITMLDLGNNKIQKIGSSAFEGLESVELIDLSVNQLDHLSSDSLRVRVADTDKISILLRNNSISTVAVDAFSHRHAPGLVDLSHNKLSYLGEMPFSALVSGHTKINVDNNPFDCRGCSQYKWLVDLDDKNKANLINFRCPDGTGLAGLTLAKIGCKLNDNQGNRTSTTHLEVTQKPNQRPGPVIWVEEFLD